jgi:hypothetical protein
LGTLATVIVRRWFLNVIRVILGLVFFGVFVAEAGVSVAAGGPASADGADVVLFAAW